MLVTIPQIISPETVRACRAELQSADWQDGRHGAGYLSRTVKSNRQLPDRHPLAEKWGAVIIAALDQHPLFTAAALPLKILPPLFNCYGEGEAYGAHIDGAIRPYADSNLRVRTDLSATLFLCEPDDYDGGQLLIEDSFGQREVKLPAGDLVLYPGTSVHRVQPVTRGQRIASFFWIQSMVRQNEQRRILFELDRAIQKIASANAGESALVDLAGVYHNLLRQWADS